MREETGFLIDKSLETDWNGLLLFFRKKYWNIECKTSIKRNGRFVLLFCNVLGVMCVSPYLSPHCQFFSFYAPYSLCNPSSSCPYLCLSDSTHFVIGQFGGPCWNWEVFVLPDKWSGNLRNISSTFRESLKLFVIFMLNLWSLSFLLGTYIELEKRSF